MRAKSSKTPMILKHRISQMKINNQKMQQIANLYFIDIKQTSEIVIISICFENQGGYKSLRKCIVEKRFKMKIR